MEIKGTTMNMRLTHLLLAIACTPITLYCGSAFANSCSKADINDYLKSGFNHEQVVKLCTSDKPTQASQPTYNSISKPAKTVTPAIVLTTGNREANNSSPSSNRNEDQIYLETVIEGNPVTLSAHSLSFKRRECAFYGDENVTGFRDKACVNTQTTINFDGLQVVRATKGTFLIREQELIVKGNITREYLSLDGLNKYKVAAVKKQLPTSPNQMNMPVKKGINPKDVVTRLKKYL